MKFTFNKNINKYDLPHECYVINPSSIPLLEKGKKVDVIKVKKDVQGFYKTTYKVDSIEELIDHNILTYGTFHFMGTSIIENDTMQDILKLMSDQSIFGDFRILNWFNNKVNEKKSNTLHQYN